MQLISCIKGSGGNYHYGSQKIPGPVNIAERHVLAEDSSSTGRGAVHESTSACDEARNCMTDACMTDRYKHDLDYRGGAETSRRSDMAANLPLKDKSAVVNPGDCTLI